MGLPAAQLVEQPLNSTAVRAEALGPTPLACVVSNSSKELGLVIVYPSSGKITFVENIDSAESLKLFDQRRRGVEGTFKLHGGEFIDQIMDTEYAGLILEPARDALPSLVSRNENGIAKISLSPFNAPTKGSFFGDLLHRSPAAGAPQARQSRAASYPKAASKSSSSPGGRVQSLGGHGGRTGHICDEIEHL